MSVFPSGGDAGNRPSSVAQPLLACAPHLDEVCAAARATPVTGFPGIHAIWIGASALPLPGEWVSVDGRGALAQAVVRDAWWQFWTTPFRVRETRTGRHLHGWQSLRFAIDAPGAESSPTGVRLLREDTLGRAVSEPVEVSLPELMRAVLGSRSRALMEAGMRRCLRAQWRQRGVRIEVPRPFLDALGIRIEVQLDARMDWALASQELLQMALGSCTLETLLLQMAPPRNRGLRWQPHVLALRQAVPAWPAEQAGWLPFAVPMHQQAGGIARHGGEVAAWLHGIGVSRQSLARLQRLSRAVNARLAGLFIDARARALPVLAQALNRFLAQVAAHCQQALRDGRPLPDDDTLLACVPWLAADALHALGCSETPVLARLRYAGTTRRDDDLPWLPSGKVEYAAWRGYRPEPPNGREQAFREEFVARGGPRYRRHEDAGRNTALMFADDLEITAPGGRGVITVIELAMRAQHIDAATFRRFCLLAMNEVLAGAHRENEFGAELQDTCDWFLRSDPPPQREQLAGGWAGVQRRVEEWHLFVLRPQQLLEALESRPERVSTEWTEWVPPTDVGHWRALQIADYRTLVEEGVAMRHCVANYAFECESADSVIFSVRTRADNARYGTAQFRRNHQGWRLVQFRGVCNRELPARDTPEPEALRELLSRLAAKLDQVDFREARRA